MKRFAILQVFILLSIFALQSCSTDVDNRITFQNLASTDILVNFRATLFTVPAGQIVNVTEVPKGSYSYETTYELPAGAQSSKAEGEVSGTVDMKAGTKILILYSSTFIDGAYTLFATKTSSDDESEEGDPNPIGP